MTCDVLGLGCAAVDDLLYVPHYPPADSKVRVLQRVRQCGGLTATALVAAARLGARCAFAGLLGPDEDSAYVLVCLQQEGIDVRHAPRRPDARPGHSTIVVDEGSGTRTIFTERAGRTGAADDAPAEEVIRSARVVFVDHTGIAGAVRGARVARSAGVPVVADLERDDGPGFPELLALVDHLIVSHDFAARLTGAQEPARSARALAAGGRQVVVVTEGARGCWFLGEGRPFAHQPAFRVQAVDTTGCGDVFHGAYAAALAEGLDLAERVRLAAAAAALKATRRGSQAGAPRRAEVETFLRNGVTAG